MVPIGSNATLAHAVASAPLTGEIGRNPLVTSTLESSQPSKSSGKRRATRRRVRPERGRGAAIRAPGPDRPGSPGPEPSALCCDVTTRPPSRQAPPWPAPRTQSRSAGATSGPERRSRSHDCARSVYAAAKLDEAAVPPEIAGLGLDRRTAQTEIDVWEMREIGHSQPSHAGRGSGSLLRDAKAAGRGAQKVLETPPGTRPKRRTSPRCSQGGSRCAC